jgi:hypothetical protein
LARLTDAVVVERRPAEQSGIELRAVVTGSSIPTNLTAYAATEWPGKPAEF